MPLEPLTPRPKSAAPVAWRDETRPEGHLEELYLAMMAVDSLDGGMWEPPSWGSVVGGLGLGADDQFANCITLRICIIISLSQSFSKNYFLTCNESVYPSQLSLNLQLFPHKRTFAVEAVEQYCMCGQFGDAASLGVSQSSLLLADGNLREIALFHDQIDGRH